MISPTLKISNYNVVKILQKYVSYYFVFYSFIFRSIKVQDKFRFKLSSDYVTADKRRKKGNSPDEKNSTNLIPQDGDWGFELIVTGKQIGRAHV